MTVQPHDRQAEGFTCTTELRGTVHGWTTTGPDFELESGAMREQVRILNGPCAPARKRPRRVAKKLALRGGYMRCRGLTQAYLKQWPAMRAWYWRQT